MRLTCPNCDAQYEVPDEVIPSEGRDVQCSNCGDTWFQNHADVASPMAESSEYARVPDDENDPADFEDTNAPDQETEFLEEEAPQQAEFVPSHLDSSVKDILREEAVLEAQIRAEETGSGIESQPDLGLDDIASESKRRARDTKERVARIRGAETDSDGPAQADPISAPDSRRGMLPDIEEINSTLHADGNKTNVAATVGPVAVNAKSKKSFTRGFAVAIILAVVLAMVYTNAPRIAQSFPQVDPALNAYVAGVDQTRLWLDNKIGELVPNGGE